METSEDGGLFVPFFSLNDLSEDVEALIIDFIDDFRALLGMYFKLIHNS